MHLLIICNTVTFFLQVLHLFYLIPGVSNVFLILCTNCFLSVDLKAMEESKQFGVTGKPRGDNLFIWVSRRTFLNQQSVEG